MLELEPEILQEYNRILATYTEVTSFPSPALSVTDVLRAHFMIANHFYLEGEGIGGVGPKDINELESTVCRQISSFAGKAKWINQYEIAATLFYGIIKNHCFYDTNKRTAFLSMIYQMHSINRCPCVSEKVIEDFTVEVAENGLEKYSRYRELKKDGDTDPEVRFIAHWIKKSMRQMTNDKKSITFRHLDKILSRYGFYLDNADRNYIDVMSERQETTGFIFKKTNTVRVRIGQIGFPRWGAEVPPGTLKYVRSITKLSSKDGVDSRSFFDGLDSMQSLISTYNEPLLRLAQR